jgi:DNA polymerase III subunit delta'
MGLIELKESLIGNSKVLSLLDSLVSSDNLASCYLLSGPKGVGKKNFAYYFASQIIYTEDRSVNTQKKLLKHSHADIKIFSPKGKLALHPAEDMRKLKQEAFLSPFEAKKKIFIIEDADRMLAASSNALLKTFEEPSPDTIFILTSSSPEKMLTTVLSRCQKINFLKTSHEEILAYLKSQGKEEQDAKIIAQISEGSLDKAKDLLAKPQFLNFRKDFFTLLTKNNTSYAEIHNLKASFEACFEKEENDFEEEKALWEGSEISAFQKEHWQKKEQASGFLKEFEVFKDMLFCYLSFYRDLQVLEFPEGRELCINQDLVDSLSNVSLKNTQKSFDEANKRVQKAMLGMQRSIKPFNCLEYLLMHQN